MKVAGIKGQVALIGGDGSAYLVPLEFDIMYNNFPTMQGLVFAVVDTKGKDKLGNKAKVYKCK